MMSRSRLTLGCLFLCAAVTRADAPPKADLRKLPPATPRAVDFRRDVRPILARACLSCHGAEKQRAGLRLDLRDEALKGGNSGPVLKPGDVSGSRLLLVVAGLDAEVKMPPEGRPSLTPTEIGHLRAWVEQGLKWPKEEAATTQGPRSSHWAFQPVRRPALPAVKDRAWVRNGIDRFVLSRLEKEGLAPSPAADRATLIRRLRLDLLGLPPSPADVDAFLADDRPDAYERLVDRLLASPHYGERWGRHWLDAARYADSDGYEKDNGRPFAWRWRDWVLNAFNADLPYDRFVVEQLAGDLLPTATTEQRVATGFHRNTLTNTEGGADQEQFRVEAVVDRVNTTARVFLGVTMGCAQCHDHKYDPLSQREYYQLFAFFNSDAEVNVPAPTPAGEAAYRKQQAEHAARRQALARQIEERKTASANPAKPDPKLAQLTRALATHDKAAPRSPMAPTLALGKPRKTHVMMRGDFLRPGVEVRPGVPAVLPPLKEAANPTRLDLARWVASPENPLTGRVLVNWAWHKYFGRGIVPTPEDFGTQGERPSHPELLDWLADEFTRGASGEVHPRRWSLKELHRLTVTSATYRQSSKGRPELRRRDPLNVLLARQGRQRLEAELVRDAALAASGLLATTVGGPSVRPPQPPGVSELTYAGSARWVESTGADRYRRGLYIWFQRTSPYPTLTTFDAPEGILCCVRREKSNTPLQALTLMNDTAFVECARALSRRIVEERPRAGREERARHGFRLCLGRSPSDRELARLVLLLDELLALAKASPDEAAKLAGPVRPAGVRVPEAAAWVALARTLMNLDEFITRE